MFQSPPKRRRTSTHTAVNATSMNTNTPTASNPTTPTRASYLSPTKASLARSHPHLVPQSNARSLTEPRGKLLRNELLSRGREEQATQATHSATDIRTNQTQAFFIPDPKERSPLRPRQPFGAAQAQENHVNEDEAPNWFLPKLVKKNETTAKAVPRARSDEPDLPPTPVQLGLDPAPERPRGLASSSSPRGSKSGSGRHRRRVRGSGAVTSSPLKPKDRLRDIRDTDEPRSEADSVREAPESEAEMEHSEDLPAKLRGKRLALQRIKAQLEALKSETVSLENAIGAVNPLNALSGNDDVLGLLNSGPGTDLTKLVAVQDLGTTDEKTLPYLTLFAPGDLQLSAQTTTRQVKGRPKIVHTLTVTAPAPWPPHAFSANFEVVADVEGLNVEKISCKDSSRGRRRSAGVHSELQTWIDKRLASDLHHLDIGGLIWGLGRYFHECVQRAKVLKTLDDTYNETEGDSRRYQNNDTTSQDELNEDEALALARYLTITQLEIDFEEQEESTIQTRKGKQSAPKLMLLWQIELNWSGGVRTTREIAPTGITGKAQQSVQEVFHRLVKSQGLLVAFGAVWDLLKGEREEEPALTSVAESLIEKRKRGRPRKRKRVT